MANTYIKIFLVINVEIPADPEKAVGIFSAVL